MKRLIALMLLITSASANARADDFYLSKIKPLLRLKCGSCHGALKQQAGLRLDAGKLIHRGGDSGAAVTAKSLEKSLIWQRVIAAKAERMPPAGEGEPLNNDQLNLLRKWILRGALFPKSETIPARPKKHWAFLPPRQVQPPPHRQSTNPIDGFLHSVQRQRGIEPAPRATRRVLMRRLYFDLVGLPPTPQQQQRFLSDDSPLTWQQLVDQLLNSPLYGQRWARHWMDVWRYSDWHGYQKQVRGSQPHIWRWRDWIVESLNRDIGYDRMVMDMLAADELAPTDLQRIRATGFLVRNFHNSNRNVWLDATVEHTAKAFLGLTIACARCHDHKYDPIAQKDFYAFRAIFEPHHVRTQKVSTGKKGNLLVRAFDKDLTVKTYLYKGGNEKHPDMTAPIVPNIPRFFTTSLQIKPVQLPSSVWEGVRLPRKKTKGKKSKKPGKPVPRRSTGRRLALARWIANQQNPLTARVAINHIWLRHFGRPLVARLEDFGLRSPRPRYARLLDWLAVELMQNNWSMKHIHRLIVTSQAWQRTSARRAIAASAKLDPDNTTYWRANIRRLESELVRDSVLSVAGVLDVSAGGPDLAYTSGQRIYRRSLYFQHAYEKQMRMMLLFDGPNPNECYRRKESVVPQQALVLANSDLVLSQSRILARRLWKQFGEKGPVAFIKHAFEVVLCRPPTPVELVICQKFLIAQAKRLQSTAKLKKITGGAKPTVQPAKDPVMRARENLIHVLMNHNDFITVR